MAPVICYVFDYYELIDSPCLSLTAPVMCYVFYVIITNFF